jgi:Ca2+-binding EF-hand superfamily protein
MNRIQLVAAAVAVALASTVALAQTATSPGPQQAKIDANGDGAIDRAEAAKHPRLAARFDQLDTNKDGKLDASERPIARKGQRRGGQRMDMHGGGMPGMGLMRMDTDGDRRISRAEAQAAAAQVNQRFDQMDVNRDGYLDRADMQARMAQRRAGYFSATDTNKDGYLSRDEFAAHRKAMQAQRQQQGDRRAMPTDEQRAQRMAGAFDRLDTDKDGRISKAEFEAARPMGGKGAGMRKGR